MRVLALPVVQSEERYTWILTLRSGGRVQVTGKECIPSYDSEHPTVITDKIGKRDIVVYSSKQVISVQLSDDAKVKSLPNKRKKAAVEG
jgi:hypothetical protein